MPCCFGPFTEEIWNIERFSQQMILIGENKNVNVKAFDSIQDTVYRIKHKKFSLERWHISCGCYCCLFFGVVA